MSMFKKEEKKVIYAAFMAAKAGVPDFDVTHPPRSRPGP